MRTNALARRFVVPCLLVFWLFAAASPSAKAIPAFNSHDNRLPNPDRPYEFVGDTIHFDSLPHFAIYDLKLSPNNPAELDTPTRNPDGNWEFDSEFKINYTAVVSFSTQPPHTVSGIGTARARGIAPAGNSPSPYDFAYFMPQVFDTELVELNLFALPPIPEIMFRESPTLRSTGRTIRENICPVCLAPGTFWYISSFFDINAEITFNGGNTWTPARDIMHIEQAPDGFPPGDYNQDRVVDTSDYIVWRQSVGQVGAGLAADGDWSGKIDDGDFAVWRSNFGTTAPTAAGTSAVPEPATIFPLALPMLALLRLRHRAAL